MFFEGLWRCAGEAERGNSIDYVLSLNDMPMWFVGIIIAIVISIGLVTKKWTYSFLFGSILVILGETVLFRIPGDMQYALTPFWSCHYPHLYPQIIANVILFIPFGFFGGKFWGWKGI